jgi:hypothetical protein
VRRYRGDDRARTLTGAEQFRVTGSWQTTYSRKILRDINTWPAHSAPVDCTTGLIRDQTLVVWPIIGGYPRSLFARFTGVVTGPIEIQALLWHPRNAMKTQVWIAVAVQVPVAIIKKELQSDPSLQMLSNALLENNSPCNRLLQLSSASRQDSMRLTD